MALGGFIYAGNLLLGPHGNTRAEWEADWNAVLAKFYLLLGWGAHTTLTRMVDADPEGSNFAISQYGAGNTGYLCWVFNHTSTGLLIHADNMWNGVTQNGSTSLQPAIWLAYIPSGIAPPTSGDPRDAAWLPAGSTKFSQIGAEMQEIYGGGQYRFHFIARGADIILAGEEDAHLASTIDNMYLAGNLIDALAQDPTDTNKTVSLTYNGNISGANLTAQTFTAAGALVTTGQGLILAADTSFLDVTTNDRAPFNWSRFLLYLSHEDLDTYGIVPGNGVKGTLNPEITRYTRSGAMSDKQRMESGNLIAIRNGYVIGWDSTNGAMA